MATKQEITLVSPSGEEWKTTDRVEATNLRARGYKVKPAKKAKQQQQEPADNTKK